MFHKLNINNEQSTRYKFSTQEISCTYVVPIRTPIQGDHKHRFFPSSTQQSALKEGPLSCFQRVAPREPVSTVALPMQAYWYVNTSFSTTYIRDSVYEVYRL